MLPIPAPVPYTLPYVLRKNRRSFITSFAIILLLCIAPWLYFAASTDPAGDPVTWIGCFLFAIFFGLLLLGSVSSKVVLTEDRISSRGWFFWKEIEYARITAVRFYYRNAGEGGSIPMLDLSGDHGQKITINFGMFDSPVNRRTIYDVLKKRASLAGINKSMEEFYTDPDTIPRIENLLPQSYTLPLTLRMHQNTSLIWFFIFPLLIVGLFIVAILAEPVMNMPAWVVWLVGLAGFSFVYLLYVLPAVRLTEDRISYREQLSWKEMEYRRITAVRYYYQNLSSTLDSCQMLEVSGDSGNTITFSIGMFDNKGNIWIIYDVLKKKTRLAGLGKSAEEFFAHPDAMAGS